MKDILLVGGGGHCGSIIDTLKGINSFNIVGIIDTPDKVGETLNSVPTIGTDDELQTYYDKGIQTAFISIGSVGDTKLRRKIFENLKSIGFDMPVIIDSTAVVSTSSEIDSGTFVGKGAIINCNAVVGRHSIINSGSIVEHDTVIGDFCHVAPGSTISGGVSIGDDTHIGANSTVIQNLTIGEKSIVGAGSVVIKNIGSNKLAYGNPCKEVSK